MTKRPHLGEFEQLVLLAVLRLDGEGYGVTVRREIEERTGRSVGLGSVYSTLDRLTQKGLLEPHVAEPTPVRGGRAKKVFRLTRGGRSALVSSLEMVERMARGLTLDPDGAL